MEKRVFSQIRSSVEEKRHNLTAWVETAPEPEKEICLTTCDNCVEEEIAVLDETLVKVETDTFGICEVCHGHIEQGVLEIDYTATICLDCLSETQRRELEFELDDPPKGLSLEGFVVDGDSVDLTVRADEGRPDELGVAARGFDATLAALRRSQAELEAFYRERMVRADRFAAVGEIATGLAHEIKNPLAGLSGALELLAEDLQRDPKSDRSHVVL